MLTAGSDKSPVTATLKWQPFFLLQHIVVIVMLNQPFIKFQSASAPHWITSRDLLHKSRLCGGCLPLGLMVAPPSGSVVAVIPLSGSGSDFARPHSYMEIAPPHCLREVVASHMHVMVECQHTFGHIV